MPKPTPKQLANLRPGVGRPVTDREQLTIRLPRQLLADLELAMVRDGIKSKSIAIEKYLKL
jgi:hypothetical protein